MVNPWQQMHTTQRNRSRLGKQDHRPMSVRLRVEMKLPQDDYPVDNLKHPPLSEAAQPRSPRLSQAAKKSPATNPDQPPSNAEELDWQTSVQKIYDRKSKERKPVREGDPQQFRQVAADLLAHPAILDDSAVPETRIAVPSRSYKPVVLPSSTTDSPWRQIVGQSFLEHQIKRGDRSTQRIDLLLSRATWEILQQFGLEAAYVFLLLLTRSAQAQDSWSEIVELTSAELLNLHLWEWESEPTYGQKLRLVGNLVELVCGLSLTVSQIDPTSNRYRALRIPFWVMEEMEYAGPMSQGVSGMQPEEPQELTIRVGLGLWHEQFVDLPILDQREQLTQFCFQAHNVLQINPVRKPIAAKLAILTLLLQRLQPGRDLSVGGILEHLASKAAVIEMQRRRDRRDHMFSRWNTNLRVLQKLGWAINFVPESYPTVLQPTWSQSEPVADVSQQDWAQAWLKAQLRIQPPELPPQPQRPEAEQSILDRFTGQNLAVALELKGLSQSKLAEHLQLDRSMVTYWIKGARHIQPKHRAQIYELLAPELQQVVG